MLLGDLKIDLNAANETDWELSGLNVKFESYPVD